MRTLPAAIVLVLLTVSCGSPATDARVFELPASSSSPERPPFVAVEDRREPPSDAPGACTIGWHGPLRASVLTIPEEIAVEAFEPARLALCACQRIAPEVRVALRFDFGAGEVTASSDEPGLDACLRAKLSPGRFRSHPEIPASDVVDPAAARPASGPIVMLPIIFTR